MIDSLKYLQIPYQHMGRDWRGADCFGLLRLFYHEELGVDLPDYDKPYAEDWWQDERLILDLYKAFQFKKVKSFEVGNVVVFNNTSDNPGHIGIILDDTHFLHMTTHGVAVNNYRYGRWARMIHSIFKLKANAYKAR